jgi:HEPN domain-containing protein
MDFVAFEFRTQWTDTCSRCPSKVPFAYQDRKNGCECHRYLNRPTTSIFAFMKPSTDALLSEFATRSFRDTADEDYIAARLAFRARLIPQFLWSSLQAFEKYLKCILVLNRIKAERGHDLSEILAIFNKSPPFDLRLTARSKKFLQFLDTYGRHRYFESSWYVMGGELVDLDRAVWEIRRYARNMQYDIRGADGVKLNALPIELARNIDAESRHPQEFQIMNGRLESILDKKDHPARKPLIWQNGFFGKSHRRSVRLRSGLQAANSPLTLHPELLTEVREYVWLPKDVIEAYRTNN